MTNTWGEFTNWTTFGAGGTWGEFAGATSVAAPGTDAPGRAVPTYPLPRVAWTIDGRAVSMFDWSCSSTWDGGYDQMRGSIDLTDLRRTTPTQGSVVAAYTDAGTQIWEGRLAVDPQIAGGVAALTGQGYRVEAEKLTERLFICSDDMGIWQPINGEPFVTGAGIAAFNDNKNISVEAGNRLLYRVDRNVTVPTDRRNGFGFYAEGVALKKIRFVMAYESADATPNLVIRLYRSNGPNGNPVGDQTFINGWTCNAGNNGAQQTNTIATPDDLLILYLHTAASFSPADPAEYKVTRVRVWSDVTTDDTFDGAEVLAYIAARFGWSTDGVVSQSFDVLPFDWDDGSWADAATYVATLEDRYWRVLDGHRLEYADWGTRDWRVYLSRGCVPDLTPEETFNTVWVWWDSPTGIRRRTEVVPADIGADDPLSYTNVYEYELEDRQADGGLAFRVGQKILRRVIRRRLSGSLDVAMAFDATGACRPMEILAGDTVTIADWGPNESLTLRVMETDMSVGTVRLGVEQPINLDALLRRRPRRRRHH